MSSFAGKGRLSRYEYLRAIPGVENLTMRSLRLTGVAMLAAAFLTGCDADSSPTAQTTPGLTADATDHNVADHFKTVETETFEVENPCNGELITFSGTVKSQMTLVAPREDLDAGFWLHMEFQQQVRATGTGSETGANYTFKEVFHEGFESPNPPAPHATFSAHGTAARHQRPSGPQLQGPFCVPRRDPVG
jgi:hypothetical protein